MTDVDLIFTNGCVAHFHSQIEILFVTKGSIGVTINGKDRVLKKGWASISSSYDIHSYSILEKGSIGKVVIIPNRFAQDYISSTKNTVPSECFFNDAGAFKTLDCLFDMLYAALSGGGADELFVKGIVTGMLGAIKGTLSYTARSNSDKIHFMRDVLRYINSHYSENITLDHLSKEFGYTPNHFSHIFNSFIDIGLKEFLNMLRTENAALLLSEGQEIVDAAFNSGFVSLRTFYRSFRKLYNTTPHKYKAARSL